MRLKVNDEKSAVARPEIILAGIGTVEGTVYDAGGTVELSGAKIQLGDEEDFD